METSELTHSLPTSQNGSFSYHQKRESNQHHQQPIVHRCRFTDYTPATITAIASTPSTWDSKSTNHRGLLAVGRGNGDIELWIWLENQSSTSLKLPLYHSKKKVSPSSSSRQAWSLYRTLPGHLPSKSSTKNSSKTSKIEHLLFTHQFLPSDYDPLDPDPTIQDQIKSLARTPPRLLGSNGADELIEWEWDGPRAGTIKRTLSMPPSVAIWSLSVSPGSTRLAIGCDDGTIRIANIADDQLELIRKFDPCKTRLLSLAWGISTPSSLEPSSSSSSSSTTNYPIEPPDSKLFLVAGCADSSIRKFALSSGRCVNRMTVEKLQGEQTLVWTLTVINGTIISGDSVGNVHFWDSKSCSRKQTIRAHRADILCIVPSPDGRSVFTSGVDQKTCQLTLNIQQHNPKNNNSISQSRWLLSTSRRLHSHDVRALEISPSYNPLFNQSYTKFSFQQNLNEMVPILISGGLDMSLVICPAGPPISSMINGKTTLINPITDSFSVSFADSMQRKISYTTKTDPVNHLASIANLLVSRNDQQISIWKLRSTLTHNHLDLIPPKNGAQLSNDNGQAAWSKVVEMELKCRTNLISSAISADGSWLAVSDLYEVKLFYMNKTEDERTGQLQPRRVKGFEPFSSSKSSGRKSDHQQGARAIEFSADSTRLILAGSLTSDLVVIGLGCTDKQVPQIKILRTFYHNSSHSVIDHSDLSSRPVITPSSRLLITSPVPTVENSDSTPQDDLSVLPDHEDQNSDPEIEPELNDQSPHSSYLRKIAVSPDGQWLATADSKKTLHIYNLDGMKHHCYLSIPGTSHINTMIFPRLMPSILILGFANNQIHIIDIETRQIPIWAVDLCMNPPQELLQLRDSLMGISFGPGCLMRSLSPSSTAINGGNQSPLIGSHQLINSSSQFNNKKVLVGLIWGANWVAKIQIPISTTITNTSMDTLLPPSINSTTTLKRRRNHIDNHGFQSTPQSIPKPKNKIKGRNGAGVDHFLISENASPTTTSIEEEEEHSTTILSKNIIPSVTPTTSGGVTINISHKYQSLLLVDFLNTNHNLDNQLVIVERPFFDLLSDNKLSFPPVWNRTGVYGT
ncbi:hypothetical protein MJO29_006536 [Puccinia striiformis f. sp. tritici]|uniref:Uncharacterized protein n=1 Tax=Puccinia striiformis f. sp. tritici PST-78 TaxID=1165861 RepID=A0A0L0VV19_9BASI|nr:hypothetical protein Pst134EA_011742 [Puccinia striiformis f. sp. tritici]KAI9619769.1 hypothetical protein H4Q26_014153 [Puccinia striiformis f. sp. tritici PST-130]KNF03123.1 hypothetical protein PSTG_03708 [Puccinia striiformis f. sp. tritici PST-78]KAH9456507.1 hypothetical protein Pst134EB_012705 [Puccinia striiformis f. sp. tritici]KAH9468121.1 hypothetical protein Pst134EA_011742 [Puccinia striiformis f. sp. tritici]KAI7958319.1 hypothetical protein MJO29_006536 [Puccinia striiformis